MEDHASVSKSMSTVESTTYVGATQQWWLFFIAWIITSMGCVYPIANRSIIPPYTFIIYFMLILWWGIFIVYFRDTPTQIHTWLHIKYLYRVYTGKSITMKYVVPLRTLENIIPTKTVHEKGIIEFKYGHWGMIMRTVSNRIDNVDLSIHIDFIKNLLDSLPDDIVVKIISSSYVDFGDSLETELLDLSNDKTKTDPQREHLYHLYNELKKEELDVIDWRCVIFIDLGQHKNLYDAELKRQEFIPGFIDGLTKADAYCVPVVDENQITQLYRKLFMVR